MMDVDELLRDEEGDVIYGQLRAIEYDPSSRVSVSLTARLTCICPFNGFRDYAVIEVSYMPTGRIIELSSFARYLSTFRDKRIGHEEITETIRGMFAYRSNADDVTVRTRWETVEGVDCTVVSM